MKLLVIFTGGTIGSTLSDGYISTDQNKIYRLLEMYRALERCAVDFDLAEPYTLLSENLTGEYLARLGNCLKDRLRPDHDGVIITHGSDTIQYTAAALSYFLPKPPVPVMLVCSQRILDDPQANGLANFAAAVDFIAAKGGTGVFVPYRNHDNVIYIHRGSRLLPHLPYSDELYSIGGQYYGVVREDGSFLKNQLYQTGQSGGSFLCEGLPLPRNWNSRILRLFPYPGMEYPPMAPPAAGRHAPAAILLDTYHSGTLCSATPGMERFFRSAAERGIPAFLTGADNGPDYDSVKFWKQLRVTTLPPASPVAMYMKLWMALDAAETLSGISLGEIMQTPVSEDIK